MQSTIQKPAGRGRHEAPPVSADGDLTVAQKHHHNQRALERIEERLAVPMLALALAVIPLLVLPLVVRLSDGWLEAFAAVEWFIWAAFLGEYLLRMTIAPHRGVFFRRNLFDLLIIALPFLRPLRVVRSTRSLRLLRAGRAVSFLGRGLQSAREILTRHKLHYALLVGIGAVVVGAEMAFELERRSPGAHIHSFAAALWWAATTVSSVGYGDLAPVTAGGKVVAVALMIVGIGLVGMIAASFVSFLVGRRAEVNVDEVNDRLRRIEALLAGAASVPSDSSIPRGPAGSEATDGRPPEVARSVGDGANR